MALDLISKLPDDVLVYILRCMETRDAVRTCILSKRWTRVWTQLPTLNINVQSFDSLDSFKYFLLGLFTHYNSSQLYSLKFVCGGPEYEDLNMDARLVDTIIDYATRNLVEHLSINCPQCWENNKLPPRLLTFLCDLDLVGLSIEFPTSFYSYFLTSIYLENVHVDGDILLSCMKLETFTMTDCSVGDVSKIVIDAPKLTYLCIDYESVVEIPEISISAPKLETINLKFHCDSTPNISLGSCPVLESVHIDFYHHLKVENTEEKLRHTYAMNIVNFLNNVCGAKSLTFTMRTIEALSVSPELLKNIPPPFHNLKYLKVYKKWGQQHINIPPEVETFLVGGSPSGAEIWKEMQSIVEKPPKWMLDMKWSFC